jgi:hypothetical protein
VGLEELLSKRLVLPAVAVIAVLALIGGAALARADHRETGGSSAFIDRVAEILGLAPEDVSSAITQARDEARAERMAAKLAEAVEAGVITQDEADALSDWMSGKPDALKTVRHHGLRSAVQAGEVEAFLADLVAQELVTQAESDAISAWLEIRPSAIDALREWRMEKFKDGGYKCDGGWHRRGGFGFHHPKFYGGGESNTTGVVASDPV